MKFFTIFLFFLLLSNIVNAEIKNQSIEVENQPIILEVGTHTIGTQTYIVPETKMAIPFSTNITILGRQYNVITIYIPSIDNFESIIYLEDRELVVFFNKAEEFINAISQKFQRTIERELLKTINFSIMVNELDKLTKPQKTGE